MCNGHADTCHVLDPLSPTRILACQCRHNTAGIHCNECGPGFEQKKWRQNTKARPFQCEGEFRCKVLRLDSGFYFEMSFSNPLLSL